MATHDPGEHRPEGQLSQPKLAEAAPQGEGRLLTAVVDNIPGCIAMVIKGGTREIVASNRLAREIGAVPGETCFAHCASRDDPCPFCLAPKLWTTGEGQEIEVEYRGKWYEATWASLSEDLYVHYIFDITERKRVEQALDHGEAAISGVARHDMDHRMICPDGEEVYVHAITQRRRMEQLLEDEVARRRLLVEQSRDGIVVLDQTGKVHEANGAFARMLGYSTEEVHRLHVWDWEAQYSKEQTLEMLSTVDDRGDHFETRHRRKDGTWFDAEISTNGTVYGGEKLIFCVCRDVSERRQSEEALAHSRDLMRFIIEHTRSAVAVYDRDLNYIYVSQRYLQEYDVKEHEVIGRHHYEVFPDLPQKWRDVHLKALAGEISSAEDDPFVHEDGHVDWTRWECRPWHEADGSIGGIVVYSEVTTDRKNAENTLRESESRYRAVVESAEAAIITADGAGMIASWNPAAERMFGHAKSEAHGRPLTLLMPERHHGGHLAGMARVESGGAQHVIGRGAVELEGLRKDGTEFPLELSLARWEGTEGSFFTAIVRDISDRKRTEESLRLSEEGYRLLFTNNPAPMWVFDNDSLAFLAVNDLAVEHYGYTREEFLGMTIQDIRPPEDIPYLHEILDRYHGEVRRVGSARHRKKDGSLIDVEITGHNLEFEGRRAVLVLVSDITEQKAAEVALRQAEDQLRQSQKMEAVGQLAGGIAHDFNNLLTAILGYTHLALASGSSTVDEVRPDLEEIRRAGERASALTEQILAFSRRQTLRPQVVLLDEVVRGLEPLLRRTIGEDIDLQITECPGLAPVEVDPHRFEQVVMNLVINSRDAMPSGGRLTLETANVELDEEFSRTHAGATPGSYVMLRVTDTGVGMDEDVKERIFEPFFTTKAAGAGTGLGLATVYGVVKQSEGSIFVTTEPGRGSSFALYLPRAAQPEVQEEMFIPPQIPAGGNETVMVVEDEEALRGLIGRILGSAGYATLVFGSAPEALAALEQGKGPIDMLLTDVMLPGPIQGHELARTILASRPHLPVLYISGYARDVLVHAGRLDEDVNLLEKPFSPGSLTETVRTVLDKHRGPGQRP